MIKFEYEIIWDTSFNNLSREVTERLNKRGDEWWTTIGGVAVDDKGFYQAMIRQYYTKENK